MGFLKLTRVNEQGVDRGPVFVNTAAVSAVVGEETDGVVEVVTHDGTYRVKQPQGEGTTSVLAQVQGGV
jgi:hypothetical protein